MGTHRYIPPEILLENKCGTPCDVFSAGVVLFVLLNGCFPFKSATNDDKWYQHIIKHADEFEQFWSSHSNCNIYYDLQARKLIQEMLEYDAEKRILIENIKKHNWYKHTPY